MTVDSFRTHVLQQGRCAKYLFRLTRFKGKAKLAVDLSGLDIFMCMAVYARLDTEKDLLYHSTFCCCLIHPVQFTFVIDHDITYTAVQGKGNLIRCFIIPVKEDLLHGEACLYQCIDLPAGYDVCSEPFLTCDPGGVHRAQSLAGKKSQAFAGIELGHLLFILPATFAHIVFIEHI